MTSIFLPSSASTQISYAVKINMADKVHRLSLAASLRMLGRHFEFFITDTAGQFWINVVLGTCHDLYIICI